ncbi:MAG: radical SAM protein [Clostridia bacterium]|nr:radical SAM protein [Clostridia bacterium]
MKISKKDALQWFRFFAALPEDQPLGIRQQEIALAVFSQIELAAEARFRRMQEEIPGLRGMGPGPSTLFVGPEEKFPGGCRSCLMGTGLSAVRKTNRCNAQCPFCYDYGVMDAIPPIGEGLWEIGGGRYREEDLELLFAIQGKPTGIAYVYLEPMMEIEKYYGIIRRFHEAGVHQHLYTNGLLATEENLRRLGEAGLDEIRFNLGASGTSENVIRSMGIAKKYISQVGIETPMTREFETRFREKKGMILDTGIDFMNCAELHLNENNLGNYWGENLYFYRMGYLSPIFSREITLRIMKAAAEEAWEIVVHDCSNRTKFARDLNQKKKEGGWFGQTSYGCELPNYPYEAFLPVLEDPEFAFLEEEELPRGYRVGDIVL